MRDDDRYGLFGLPADSKVAVCQRGCSPIGIGRAATAGAGRINVAEFRRRRQVARSEDGHDDGQRKRHHMGRAVLLHITIYISQIQSNGGQISNWSARYTRTRRHIKIMCSILPCRCALQNAALEYGAEQLKGRLTPTDQTAISRRLGYAGHNRPAVRRLPRTAAGRVLLQRTSIRT